MARTYRHTMMWHERRYWKEHGYPYFRGHRNLRELPTAYERIYKWNRTSHGRMIKTCRCELCQVGLRRPRQKKITRSLSRSLRRITHQLLLTRYHDDSLLLPIAFSVGYTD